MLGALGKHGPKESTEKRPDRFSLTEAIDGVDAKGVLSQADFEAINAGLGV